MIFLSLIIFSSSAFVERPIDNAQLSRKAQMGGRVGSFAIDNDGEVAYCYDTHINRYRLTSRESREDAEAILFRLIGGKADVRTTSQFAHADNGTPSRGHFLGFLGVDDWSNVWFLYSTTPYDHESGLRRHMAHLQIDQRGDNPNKSWDLPGSTQFATMSPNRIVHAIVGLGPGKYSVDSYRVDGSKVVRLKRLALPVGLSAMSYDPITRRCISEAGGKTVIVHVPSGAKRELPKPDDYYQYTMALGKVYCQTPLGLLVDDGNTWTKVSDDFLLGVSSDGKQWLLNRPGKGLILRTYRD